MNKFVKNILSPIERFLALQASSGIILLGSAILALIFANTSFREVYEALCHYPIALSLGDFTLEMTLQHWVNDGLMVIFFFVVGLEIKRELIQGSLSSRKEAFLPFISALGGMVVPALIYIAFNGSEESIVGWGIPMATDIAFAIGVLAFVSKNVPFSLKIFLLTLATIDDLGAVLVIASFYSSNLSGFWISLSGLLVFFIFCLRQLRVQSSFIYLLLGVCLWFFILKSGIHATIAGVILGLMTPVRPLTSRKSDMNRDLNELINEKQLTTYHLERVKKKLRDFQSPAQLLIDRLHSFVGFVVMPVFAFVNSGLHFHNGFSFSEFSLNPVFKGIFLGLFLGKPAGVFLFAWAAVRLKWTQWPAQVRPMHILGIGCLAGIGFTMALFISSLSLNYDVMLANYSKVGIFCASLLSGVAGFTILFLCQKKK